MCDFVNPGILGSRLNFKNEYEDVITNSRDPQCSSFGINQGKIKTEKVFEINKSCLPSVMTLFFEDWQI